MTWKIEVQVAMNKSKTSLKTTVEWNQVNWRKLERYAFKLQKRIYQASQRGDVKTVRKLQKLLIKSWSAKCIAVRRVTQDNQGKQTAGVDGVKSLSPAARLSLVKVLRISSKAKPTRRVWIPKPGTEEKRPLGIPTIYDRALQALVKLALEPEWEANFEPNSYGFRPGRSSQDAVAAIFSAIRYQAKFVLDADIAKCFDRINHKTLLKKVNTSPTLRRQIRAWLKAGVMDGNKLFPTSEGTPQGGIISPLLANIALHGMEYWIQKAFPKKDTKRNGKYFRFASPYVIRYADDFVILHEEITVVQRCQQIISEWLKDLGLELKPSKTRISHTLQEFEGNVGFDFLGFNIRQYPVGKNRTGKLSGKPLGFKTLIKPCQEKVIQHCHEIGEIIKAHKSAPQLALIGKLNPIIRGWANYYSGVVSQETFSKADHITYKQLLAWAKRRHPNKGTRWAVHKYWKTIGNDHWRFAAQSNEGYAIQLAQHSETTITRHIKVQGNRSPYDGDWIYWSTRLGKHPEARKEVSRLLKQQKGKCSLCRLYFKDGDLLEIDHIIPRSQGGKNEYKNFQLLHRHCHDIKTAIDAVGTKELEEFYDDSPNRLNPNRGN